MIRINSDWEFYLDQFELRLFRIENLVRIHSDSCLGLNRIRSERFFTDLHETSYKTFFGLARIQISEWIGIVLIGSEWILIRYFRQGRGNICSLFSRSCTPEICATVALNLECSRRTVGGATGAPKFFQCSNSVRTFPWFYYSCL